MAGRPNKAEEFCNLQFDYLIVGGGSAGLALAARLSEDPSITVGVLEAGELILDNSMYKRFLLNNSKYQEPSIFRHGRFFLADHSPSMNTEFCWHIANMIVGGSSLFKFENLSRGFNREYDDWERLGNVGWNWEALKPYFWKVEERHTFKVFDSSLSFRLQKGALVWQDAWTEQGISAHQNNWGESRTAFSMYYLPSAHRQNLHVLPEACVQQVLFNKEDDKLVATSVEFEFMRKEEPLYTCKAAREVIICAGATGSPIILERSGIGGEESLEPYHVEILVDNPRVGENLQDHSYSYTVVKARNINCSLYKPIRETIYEHDNKSLCGNIVNVEAFVNFMQASLGRTPPPTERELNAIQRLPSLRKQYELILKGLEDPSTPCFQYKLLPMRVNQQEDSEVDHVAVTSCISRPFSRGSIHMASDIDGETWLEPLYLEHPFDTRLLRTATQPSHRLMHSYTLKPYVDAGPPIDPMILTDQDYDNQIQKYYNTFIEPVGTCSMLPRVDGGVVDSNLIVYGTENLRVVDASIIPLHISGPVLWTVYAIAEKAADIIISQRQEAEKKT